MPRFTTLQSPLISRAFAALLLASLASCANHYTPEAVADPYGFFSGLWHGFIFMFSVIGLFISWLASLLALDVLSDVQIIGRPNTGLWYYVGFALGLLSASSPATR